MTRLPAGPRHKSQFLLPIMWRWVINRVNMVTRVDVSDHFCPFQGSKNGGQKDVEDGARRGFN